MVDPVRVLDAGVAVIEEVGLQGFSVAAVSERAGVDADDILGVAGSEDELLIEVYQRGVEHAILRHPWLTRSPLWPPLEPAEWISAVVTAHVDAIFSHRQFLRGVVVAARADAKLERRGRGYSSAIGARFEELVAPVVAEERRDRIRTCFEVLFAAIEFRVVYGQHFTDPASVDDEEFAERLADMIVASLLR